MQVPNRFVIGIFGANATQRHHFITCNWEGCLEAVEVPALEKCHVKAHMRRCEPWIGFDIGEKCVHVAYVIHDGNF